MLGSGRVSLTFENCWVMGRVRFRVVQFWVESGFRAVRSDSVQFDFLKFRVRWGSFRGRLGSFFG